MGETGEKLLAHRCIFKITALKETFSKAYGFFCVVGYIMYRPQCQYYICL